MTEEADPRAEFDARNQRMVRALAEDEAFLEVSRTWLRRSAEYEYSYHFTWLGQPIIQYPQDIVALQEVLWKVRPEVVIETGIAHGGSLLLSASILELLGGENRRVIGIDVDIRAHNRAALEQHSLAKRIELIEGSSTEDAIVSRVRALASGAEPVVVILDANHSHEHVLRELELYSPLVTRGAYLVVFDTIVEFFPDDAFPDRPWGRGSNPYTAVKEFLRLNDRFEVDEDMENKLVLTTAPSGYLRCVK